MFSRSFSKVVVGVVEAGGSTIPCCIASLVGAAESPSNEYLGTFSRRLAIEDFVAAGELELGIPRSEDVWTIYPQIRRGVPPADSEAASESTP
jgi:hypothetical protein